jgi:hypothetical protein
MVKQIDRMKKNAPAKVPPAVPVAPAEAVLLLREIRNRLKKQLLYF